MKKITAFKWTANLEGISFLLLLGIAMPLKYFWQEPWLVQQLGMAHGILFVAYVIAVLVLRRSFSWNTKETLLALFLSFVPFGTFYVTGSMMKRHYAT
jgi:integral membrane protein